MLGHYHAMQLTCSLYVYTKISMKLPSPQCTPHCSNNMWASFYTTKDIMFLLQIYLPEEEDFICHYLCSSTPDHHHPGHSERTLRCSRSGCEPGIFWLSFIFSLKLCLRPIGHYASLKLLLRRSFKHHKTSLQMKLEMIGEYFLDTKKTEFVIVVWNKWF